MGICFGNCSKRWKMGKKCIFKCLFFFFFLLFSAAPAAYGGSQTRGLIGAVASLSTLEPQQLGIQPKSATYTTAYGNARVLTH